MTWPRIPLGRLSVLGPQYGANVKAISPGGDRPRYVRITDIDDWGRLRPDSIAEPNGEDLDDYLLNDGDILLARSGATVGKSYMYSPSDGPCVFAGYLIRFRPDLGSVEPKYVRYFLQTPDYWTWIASKKRVAAQPNVNGAEYASLRIPLAPPSEQRRIVDILDQADALRKLRAEADAKAERILPALFIKMFGDPAMNPMGWPQPPIDQLATVTTGNTPSRKKPEHYGSHIEWVKSDNLNTPSHYITPTTERLSAKGMKVGRTVPAGSTLVTCIAGSPSAIGNAALADRDVTFNQQINAATPRDGVDPYFLYAHFVVGKRLIQAASTGGMKGLVSKSRFSLIQFLAPPSELQESFGLHCKELCDQNELRLQQAAKLERLFAVLLHEAFSGELTASWREAHMKELLQEMEQQAKVLGGPTS